MRCLWFLSLLAVCALHAEAVAVDNPSSATGSKAGRHRHPQHLRPFRGDDASSLTSEHDHRSGNKLRHHASASASNHFKAHADAVRPNSKLNSSFSKAEKFPKLRELSKRLESMRSPATTATTTTTERPPYFLAGRAKWKHVHDYDYAPVEEVREDYDGEEGDVDKDDAYVDEVARTTSTTTEVTTNKATHPFAYEDETSDEDVNEDYYEDEIFTEDTMRPPHDVQAEEGHHEQSPMTQYKWEKFGTRQALEKSQHESDAGNNDRKNVRAANEHFLHMKSAAKCRLPRPRVVSVQEVHQLPGKAFRPHCTVLYRCGDDTGCCQGHGKKCRVKTQEIIHLHFYVYSTTFSQSQTVERLAFHNHTECACLDEEETKVSSRLIRSRGHYNRNSLPQDRPSCKCPELFASTMNHRFGRCACDCPASGDGLSGCTNMKRGEEHLSLRDRKCILDDKCTPPTCKYGAYHKHKGRCPRRHESAAAGGGTHTNALSARSDSDNDDGSFED